jgi:hypothetical protein
MVLHKATCVYLWVTLTFFESVRIAEGPGEALVGRPARWGSPREAAAAEEVAA